MEPKLSEQDSGFLSQHSSPSLSRFKVVDIDERRTSDISTKYDDSSKRPSVHTLEVLSEADEEEENDDKQDIAEQLEVVDLSDPVSSTVEPSPKMSLRKKIWNKFKKVSPGTSPSVSKSTSQSTTPETKRKSFSWFTSLFGRRNNKVDPVITITAPTPVPGQDIVQKTSSILEDDVEYIAPEIVKTQLKTPGKRPGVYPPKRKSLGEQQDKILRNKEIISVMRGTIKLHPDFTAKYTITELLGDGAFGFVFAAITKQANNNNTRKEVAVKFIIKESAQEDNWVLDEKYGYIPFEAHILSKIRHPNIIKFLDLYSDDRYVYLVTELHGVEWYASNPLLDRDMCPGLKLAVPKRKDMKDVKKSVKDMSDEELLKRKRVSCDLFECIDAHNQGLPMITAQKIFKQIMTAVSYLHELGYVHRDIKDENIVVSSTYHVKIIDFGSCSKVPSRKSEYFDRFNGTLHFASPEILRGESYRGPEAEVWALGVLLYTMVYAENPYTTTESILRGRPKFYVTHEGSEFKDLCVKMMDLRVGRRITVKEVLKHPFLNCVV